MTILRSRCVNIIVILCKIGLKLTLLSVDKCRIYDRIDRKIFCGLIPGDLRVNNDEELVDLVIIYMLYRPL